MSKPPENMSDSGKVVNSFIANSVAQSRNEDRTARAVAWEVPIDVYGSNAIEDGTGGSPQVQPFQEHTHTVIVSPEKGVFSLATPISISQILLLTNLKSEKNAFCRVINVRKHANERNYVEVEFTTAMPGFWGADFEPHISEVLKKTVSEISSIEPAQWRSNPVRQESSSLAPRIEASNIGIIGQESLRRSVSVTVAAKSAKRKTWQSWKPVAAAVGFVVILCSGGFFLGHLLANDTLDLQPLSAPRPQMLASSTADHRTAQPVKAGQPVPVPAFQLPETAFGSGATETSKPNVPGRDGPPEILPPTRSRSKAPDRGEITDFFGSLHAHPTAASHRSISSRPDSLAPVNAIPAVPEPIPGQVALSSPALPSPNPSLGDAIKEPRLAFSQTPQYPAVAKLGKIEGDVVVEALIDQSGKVVDASFVSGPNIFREAALEAVRRWRYEPRISGGQTVPSEITIRIKFRLSNQRRRLSE